MIFQFVVRRLRWLGRVPLLPQVFDAFLLMLTALGHRGRLRAIELLEQRAVASLHADLGLHRFGGTGFLVNGRELGHVHGNGLVDALVGRENRETLVAAGRVQPHHIFPRSGWVSFWMHGEGDVDRALEILALARKRLA